MKLKFYGVRGSYPVPGASTNKYGGNTTCVTFTKQVDGKTVRLIIDMGTGAIDLGNEIIKNYFHGEEDLNLVTLFTHLHPDHTQAFPFFAPNYFAECNIQLLGMETLKKNVGTVLKQEMLPPTFPIEYSDLKSNRKHFILKDGQTIYIDYEKNIYFDHQSKQIEKNQDKLVFEVKVMQSFAPSHPQQGALYYTVKDLSTNKKVACIWDIESHSGGDRRVINFSRECDLMIHDTQFTNEEYNDHKMVVQGFGHSTYDMAIENASLAGIKDKLICMHYNPSHSDDKLQALEDNFLVEKNKILDFTVFMAKEGLEIEV